MQSGLAKDLRRLAYYRAILQNPRSSFNNSVYRDLAGELLDSLTNYVINDAQIFNRLRQDLIADRKVKREELDNLMEKAEATGIEADVVLEVYRRGLSQDFPMHLTAEQRAFNRVNSYLAKGGAYYEDADLRECDDPSSREEGTDSIVNCYKTATPGQGALKTIRKVVKKKI